MNRTGSFVMRAERVGAATVLAQIVQMVATARRSKGPIQALADKVAAVFVPVVVAVAVPAFVAWRVWGPAPGLLVKGGEVLKRLANLDTLVIDKTGTLTTGKPMLTDATNVEVLNLAAAVQAGSAHPMAAAILAAAKAVPTATDFLSITGKGVQAKVGGRLVSLGNDALMRDLGLVPPDSTALRAAGKKVMFVAVDGQVAGLDAIKPVAAEAVKALQPAGLRVIMATGDAEATAQVVALAFGIDEVHAGLLPEGKKALVDSLYAQGRKVAMAGDGVNDAPALAAAEVGIAMGPGADVAVEIAGMTLLSGDLAGILRGRKLAQATTVNIRQNLFSPLPATP